MKNYFTNEDNEDERFGGTGYEDLDFKLTQLEKPDEFNDDLPVAASRINLDHLDDDNDEVRTMDELKALGIQFEDYKTRQDNMDSPAVEMDDTWTIDPLSRRLKVQDLRLPDSPDYDIGEFDDPPKP
eukprot:UN03319